MATRPVTRVPTYQDGNVLLFKWEGLLNGDDGAPAIIPQVSDKSVQVYGTFGVGGQCTVEGTLAPDSPYNTLESVTGELLTLSTTVIDTIAPNVYLLRPKVIGDGTTNLTVVVLGTRTH